MEEKKTTIIQRAAAQQQMQQKPQDKKAQASINVMLNSMLDGEKLRGRFDEVLGKRAPQFISSMVTLINSTPQLQRAFYEAPMTVIQSCLKAATFDLPIDPSLGYAYVVPFKNAVLDQDGKKTGEYRNEATFILGWKGMHQLANRTGAYKIINVTDVREGELKSYNRLTEETEIEFVEDEDVRESLPIVGYIGYYRLINGAEKTIYMSRKQIEKHEMKFRKGKFMGKGWRDDWDAMAKKTVYRQLIGKWGVMSIDYQTHSEAQALANQMAAEDGLPGDLIPGDAPGTYTLSEDEYTVDESTGEVKE